jgi:hypothetical protein
MFAVYTYYRVLMLRVGAGEKGLDDKADREESRPVSHQEKQVLHDTIDAQSRQIVSLEGELARSSIITPPDKTKTSQAHSRTHTFSETPLLISL